MVCIQKKLTRIILQDERREIDQLRNTASSLFKHPSVFFFIQILVRFRVYPNIGRSQISIQKMLVLYTKIGT